MLHTVKYMNVLTRVFILRCPRDHHKAVWAAVSTITHLEKIQCAFKLLHLGGTIRSCQNHLIKHNKKQLQEMIRSAPSPGFHSNTIHSRTDTPSKKRTTSLYSLKPLSPYKERAKLLIPACLLFGKSTSVCPTYTVIHTTCIAYAQ